LQKINVTCSGASDGQLEVLIQDGKEPFVYSWSNGAATAIAQNLLSGVYSVTIVDADGNTLTLTETLTAPSPIIITETVVNASCSGVTNGSINLSVTGGSGGYSFAWSNGSVLQNLANLRRLVYRNGNGRLWLFSQKTFMLTNAHYLAHAALTNTSCSQPSGGIDLTPSEFCTYTFQPEQQKTKRGGYITL
jgi:hypothetical protein